MFPLRGLTDSQIALPNYIYGQNRLDGLVKEPRRSDSKTKRSNVIVLTYGTNASCSIFIPYGRVQSLITRAGNDTYGRTLS